MTWSNYHHEPYTLNLCEKNQEKNENKIIYFSAFYFFWLSEEYVLNGSTYEISFKWQQLLQTDDRSKYFFILQELREEIKKSTSMHSN